jgi:hypothetical protein
MSIVFSKPHTSEPYSKIGSTIESNDFSLIARFTSIYTIASTPTHASLIQHYIINNKDENILYC